MDYLKEIEFLKERLSLLESTVLKKDSSINAFGRSYSKAGSTDSDFLILTKGQVKIQWGKKFIDLIKDGKINVDSLFIYLESLVGVKDGIYVIDEGLLVILKVGDLEINLKGEIGNTYVSFQGELLTSSELKYQALSNIGFIYKDFSSVDSSSLQNGIIYIESLKKLYIILNGDLSEFSIEIPNPYPKLLIILKQNLGKGALLIKGDGIDNSLAFNSTYIYTIKGATYFESQNRIFFKIGDQLKIVIDNDSVTFSNKVVSETFLSLSANEDLGFRLYVSNNKSTLEVDNLIVRNGIDINYPISMYPKYWYYENNVILSIESNDVEDSVSYDLQFFFENKFLVGDSLYVYARLDENELVLLSFKVLETSLETIKVSLISGVLKEERKLINQTIFLAGSELTPPIIVKRTSKGFDIILSKGFQDDEDINKVSSRFGDLTELLLKGRDNELEIPISGSGVYSDNGAFLKALYVKDYYLPLEDNSSKFASTEWVHEIINKTEGPSLNLLFNNKIANTQTVRSWISNNLELSLLISDTIEEVSILGKHGIITLKPEGRNIRLIAWVSALTEDNDYSFRSINCIVNSSTHEVFELSSYILFTRYIGYYLAKVITTDVPEDFTYIGTTKLKVTKEYPCLWYYDGVSWSLIDTFFEDTSQYIFIRSTSEFIYSNKDSGYYKYLPAGFLCYVTDEQTIECGYGKSRYISKTPVYTLEKVLEKLEIIESLILDPTYNIKPNNSNYSYMWAILKDEDFTDPSNWLKLSNENISTSVSWETPGSWFNCDAPSDIGYSWWNFNDDKIITSKIRDCKRGTLENWKDKEWVKFFFTYVISLFLNKNLLFYNNITGWNFYYLIGTLIGSPGLIGIYFGEGQAPTSDDPEDPEYFPVQNTYKVSGYVNSFNFYVAFDIQGLTIGKKLDNVGIGQDLSIGQVITNSGPFYEINFVSYIGLVTNLDTGVIEFIKG